MCVILLSEKGKDAPTEEQIKQAFRRNPDGAGFAYCDKSDDNKVKWEKGFMTVDSLLERLEPLEQWKDTTLAIHFRIGTAGKNDKATCHPFPISTVFGDLRKTSGEGAVLFHNGILNTGGWADPLSSDTQDFVIATAPLFRKYNKSVVRDKFIEDCVIGNRLLVMYDDNKIKLYGDWKKSDEGDLLVSNKLWEDSYYTYSYKPYAYDDGYAYNSKYGYSGSYGSTSAMATPKATTTTDTLGKLAKEELDKLWDKLERDKFVWFDDVEQFDKMLDSADEISGNIAMKNGTAYVFDYEELSAWDASLDGYDY